MSPLDPYPPFDLTRDDDDVLIVPTAHGWSREDHLGRDQDPAPPPAARPAPRFGRLPGAVPPRRRAAARRVG